MDLVNALEIGNVTMQIFSRKTLVRIYQKQKKGLRGDYVVNRKKHIIETDSELMTRINNYANEYGLKILNIESVCRYGICNASEYTAKSDGYKVFYLRRK